MKNFLKVMVAVLVVIPCAFAFTACGQLGTEASVNIKGKYAAATLEDATKFVTESANAETKAFAQGLRTTAEIKYSGTYEDKKIDVQAYVNGVVTFDKEGKITGMAMKTTTPKMEGLSEYDSSEELYYKDGKLYNCAKYGDTEYKYQVEISEVALYTKYLTYTNTNVAAIVAEFAADDYKVEKAVSGKTTKWHIVKNTSAEDATVEDYYFVYTDGILTGIQMGTSMDLFGLKMEIKVTVSAFDGSIKFPGNLDSYSTTLPDLSSLIK